MMECVQGVRATSFRCVQKHIMGFWCVLNTTCGNVDVIVWFYFWTLKPRINNIVFLNGICIGIGNPVL